MLIYEVIEATKTGFNSNENGTKRVQMGIVRVTKGKRRMLVTSNNEGI